MMEISVNQECWPLKRAFTISRNSRTHTDVVRVEVSDKGFTGTGECVPNKRYGETVESVLEQIKQAMTWSEDQLSCEQLQQQMSPGAARNALDCALWDLEAKRADTSITGLVGLPDENSIVSAQTIGLGSPSETAARAREFSDFPLLKIKVNNTDVLETLTLINTHAPGAKLLIDANEAWDYQYLCAILPALKELPVVLIEQPLPAGQDHELAGLKSPVPLCADESLHTRQDLMQLEELYDCINIKLDKAGGLTEGLALAREAKQRDLKVMVGCMVGTSLSMSPAYILAQLADFADLDAPTLLKNDRTDGFIFDTGLMVRNAINHWGRAY